MKSGQIREITDLIDDDCQVFPFLGQIVFVKGKLRDYEYKIRYNTDGATYLICESDDLYAMYDFARSSWEVLS